MNEQYSGSRRTWYSNHLYDSQLEAQWAYFFDKIGEPYIPHPATFTTRKDGVVYTPDFYLCEENWFCEVKPADWALDKTEVQQRISAAMDHFATPVGHGLLILGAMTNFRSNKTQTCILGGEFYEWISGSIVKSFWTIRKSDNDDSGIAISIQEPDWSDSDNFSRYPRFSKQPSATLLRDFESGVGSNAVYKAIFSAMYAKDEDGVFTYEPNNTNKKEWEVTQNGY